MSLVLIKLTNFFLPFVLSFNDSSPTVSVLLNAYGETGTSGPLVHCPLPHVITGLLLSFTAPVQRLDGTTAVIILASCLIQECTQGQTLAERTDDPGDTT